MPKFYVDMAQTVIEECTVEIEAATQEAAEEKALGAAMNADWRFLEACGDVEILASRPAVHLMPAQIHRDRGGYE